MNTDFHRSEAEEARALRDAIYGPTTENNWESCRDAWIKDLPWLRSHNSGICVSSVKIRGQKS